MLNVCSLPLKMHLCLYYSLIGQFICKQIIYQPYVHFFLSIRYTMIILIVIRSSVTVCLINFCFYFFINSVCFIDAVVMGVGVIIK